MLEIAVTNRHLCEENYFTQIEKIASHKPFAILLREKDLHFDKYLALSQKANRICAAFDVPLIAHTYAVPEIARLHMPFAMASDELARQYRLSASVHSCEEARAAEAMGAEFLIAGHIFATESKLGVPPRGIKFLREICDSVKIPVFAIGGITSHNTIICLDAGASGICRMSYWMEI